MNRGLRAPVASVSGQDEVLPALSCRASETDVVHDSDAGAGAIVAALVTGTTAEISVDGTVSAIVHFIASASPPATAADRTTLAVTKGFRRRLPAGATLIEVRALVPGDTLLVHVDAACHVRVHDHTGAA